jgi:hypothetical protein
MKGKRNYRNISECERELYHTNELLKAHKISPSEANAICRVCDSWVKTRKAANSDELIRRVEGLEVLAKSKVVK